MRTLIDRLVASGNAYVAEDNVLFSVPSMPDYGQLSKRPLDEMIAGARVDVAPYKKDPQDFVLWKPSKPGEPAWPSPGRHRGAGPPRLAHRMLGDVVEASRRDFRHPWRRHRSRLSAPRERDRAIALRLPHAGDGELLDAQRLPAGRRREDVEVARQLRDDPRAAERLAWRSRASHDAADALSPADQLDGGGLARGAENSRSLVWPRQATSRPAIFAPMRSTHCGDDLNTPKAIAALHRIARRGGEGREACWRRA